MLLQIVGESLCEAVDLLSTDRVLDVAAGNGNAALAAARRFADVTATNYVPALLQQGKLRAAVERLPMTFRVAAAEQLPFPQASFDVVLSTFGVMFVPNQERAVAELLRVVKPGGRIAALDGDGQEALHAALIDLLRAHNQGRGDALVIPGESLEVVVTK